MSFADDLKEFLPTRATKLVAIGTIGLAATLLGDLKRLELIGIQTKALEEPMVRLVLMLCILLLGTLWTLFLVLSHYRKPPVIAAKPRVFGRINAETEKYLLLLNSTPSVTDKKFAEILNKDIKLVSYHLTQLLTMNFVTFEKVDETENEWSIKHYGMEYLIKTKLIDP